MQHSRWLVALVLWSFLQPGSVIGCRYNVRDVGFVDLGTEPYHLYGFVRRGTPADLVALFKTLPATALRDSNVSFELVNVDEQKQHPALKFLPENLAGSLPLAVLVSPDGQALPRPIAKPAQPFRQTLSSALEAVVSSPKRDEILRAVRQTFAGVLLIEGDNAGENDRARQAITNAIAQIRTQMKWLPKAIAQPPVLIALDPASRVREEILLWSLHTDTAKTSGPRAAVLYGKARWIGPLMKGEEITERNLTGILSIIGADCECGLDVSWTQGTRLPVRWDPKRNAQIAKSLGFDPENPIVKIEASRIIGRRGAFAAGGLGYQEVTLDGEVVPARTEPASATGTNGPRRAAPDSPADWGGSVLGVSDPVVRESLLVVLGLGLAIVSSGLLLVWRAARKKRLR